MVPSTTGAYVGSSWMVPTPSPVSVNWLKPESEPASIVSFVGTSGNGTEIVCGPRSWSVALTLAASPRSFVSGGPPGTNVTPTLHALDVQPAAYEPVSQ